MNEIPGGHDDEHSKMTKQQFQIGISDKTQHSLANPVLGGDLFTLKPKSNEFA